MITAFTFEKGIDEVGFTDSYEIKLQSSNSNVVPTRISFTLAFENLV